MLQNKDADSLASFQQEVELLSRLQTKRGKHPSVLCEWGSEQA